MTLDRFLSRVSESIEQWLTIIIIISVVIYFWYMSKRNTMRYLILNLKKKNVVDWVIPWVLGCAGWLFPWLWPLRNFVPSGISTGWPCASRALLMPRMPTCGFESCGVTGGVWRRDFESWLLESWLESCGVPGGVWTWFGSLCFFFAALAQPLRAAPVDSDWNTEYFMLEPSCCTRAHTNTTLPTRLWMF